MKWTVIYHHLVGKEDKKKIDPYHWRLIIDNIDKKLTTDPVHYGKPLHGKLKGFYKLSVEKYRAIYQIQKSNIIVWVIKIGPRKDDKVYIDFLVRKEKM